ncbi:MAG: ATP-binding cassette domain-containing protein [Coriobacteriia bacterium]|nr:ATP-binding cassette domain-containing protein [Coriobacteriia bacterium]
MWCVTLDIRREEVDAIMGPSGISKSTVMCVAGRLDTPDSGEVWTDGSRVDQLRCKDLVKARRSAIGFIFHGFNLIPTLSAQYNVALSAEYTGHSRRREAAAHARALLELVGLGDRMRHAPTSCREANSNVWQSHAH